METSSRIASARQARNLTQKEIADALRVSVQAVSLWETGKATPKGERLNKLASILEVSTAWLRGESDTKNALSYQSKIAERDGTPLVPLSSMISVILALNDTADTSYDFVERYLTPTLKRIGRQFAVKMIADHPGGIFHAGDIAIFDMGIMPQEGDVCVVARTGSDRSIRKVDEKVMEFTGTLQFSFAQLSKEDIDSIAEDGVSHNKARKKPMAIIATMVERRVLRFVPDNPETGAPDPA